MLNPQFAFISPTKKQTKRNAWRYFKWLGHNIPGIVFFESELKVEFPNATGSITTIYLEGADDPDTFRGMYLDGVVMDEVAQMPDGILEEVFMPAMMERKGWAILLGTPKGKNGFFRYYEKGVAKEDGIWSSHVYPVSKTKIFDETTLQRYRRQAGNAKYLQEYECFKAGTLVTTQRGNLPIEQLRISDTVLTHRNRWRPIIRTMNKEYSGTMQSLKIFGSSEALETTPEHPFLVYDKSTQTRRWVKAKDLKQGDYALLPKYTRKTKTLSSPFIKLLAWFICEGSVTNNAVEFSLNTTKPSEIEEVRQVILSCGYEPKDIKQGLSINNTSLADLLVGLCGNTALHKRIPFDMILGSEEEFFTELMKGDGSHYCPEDKAGHFYQFSTISKGLAHDVQVLASTLNRRSSITSREEYMMISPNNGKSYKAKKSYGVRISDAKISSRSNEAFPTKYGFATRVISNTETEFTGTVYNLSVKGDESYTANNIVVHNCSFEAIIEGSFYGETLENARNEGRIGYFPYNSSYPVITSWDLGSTNKTCVWFMQLINDKVYFIDYVEGSNKTIPYFIDLLKSKNYNYSVALMPHDVKQNPFSVGGKSRLQEFRDRGLKCRVVDKTSIEEGINASRTMLEVCYINEVPCKAGLEALFYYHCIKSEAGEAKPYKDWSSDPSDAFRYAAVGLKPSMAKPYHLIKDPYEIRRLTQYESYNPLDIPNDW
jgi:hypothetical protein